MKKLFFAICLIVSLMSMPGCIAQDDEGNDMVKIYNETSKPIWVYYEADEEWYTESRSAYIRSGSSRTIYITSVFWDGAVTIEYAGKKKTFDLDFNVLGYASIHVQSHHFD